MSRSVYVPPQAVKVEYAVFEHSEDYFAQEDWDDAELDAVVAARSKYPSLNKANGWLGREGHIVLENSHGCIGISEYMGLVAVWIAPKENGATGLHEAWCSKVDLKPLAECFGDRLISLGHFSNGEGAFRRVNDGRTVTTLYREE